MPRGHSALSDSGTQRSSKYHNVVTILYTLHRTNSFQIYCIKIFLFKFQLVSYSHTRKEMCYVGCTSFTTQIYCWEMEANSLRGIVHLHAVAWDTCHVPHISYFKTFSLSPYTVSLGVEARLLRFWRNHQSFWENMFKVKLKNRSNFIICFTGKKSCLDCSFFLFSQAKLQIFMYKVQIA